MSGKTMTPLAVKASGMVTAVGFNSEASCAAIRAGISGVREANLWDAESGKYLSAGKVDLPHWWVGLGKLAELVAPAIQECLEAAKPTPPNEIPILLGVCAGTRPHRFSGIEEHLLEEVEYRLDLKHHPDSTIIPRGRVSGVVGLQISSQLFAEGKAQYCIVAGVDSFLQQELVEYYLEQRRILTAINSNGFIPGEAGSAILVTVRQNRSSGAIQILGTGMDQEVATIESEEPLLGDGLTKAIGEAFKESGLSIDDVQYRITDLNGEHYKFKEMVLSMTRYERKPKPKLFDLWHPIEYIGEIGTAIGPIVLGIALHAGQKGYGIGPTALCTFGNDSGERASAVVNFRMGENNS